MAVPRSTKLFQYTSGRWLYNESKRLRERYLPFNIIELSKAAAALVGRRDNDVQSVKKIAEGGFNSIFELTMKDGFQLIARLPYPMTQPKRLAVASEVATMNLVRSHGLPVPQVYGYSTNADNPVGVEYILMEKSRGKALGDVWFTLSQNDRIKVVSDIAKHEAKLFSLDLPASGSIYYEEDLPHGMGKVPCQGGSSGKRLCVGPDASLKFWFETRSALDIERDPCLTRNDVLSSPAIKEMAWLQKHAVPRMPFDRVYRDITGYQKSDPQEHYKHLETYLRIADRLVPKEAFLNRPTLRHPDLNPNNIFISYEADVVGLIDWQHTKILPLFLQAGIPSLIQNYGDPASENLSQPQLPDDLDDLDADDREKELELYRRRHVDFYYVGATAKHNDRHFKALMHPAELFRRQIFQHAGEPWEGNNVPLKADLVRVMQQWDSVDSGTDSLDENYARCPIAIDAPEADAVLDAAMKQEEADSQMDILRNVIGVGSDGWVAHEGYADAVAQASEMKEQAIAYAEDENEREMTVRHWPFDDHDETE